MCVRGNRSRRDLNEVRNRGRALTGRAVEGCLLQVLGAEVAGEDDDGVLEVHDASLRICVCEGCVRICVCLSDCR